MRVAYADPPYPGCAHLYRGHADYGGGVDHAELVARLVTEYDGYCLHTSSVALGDVLARFRLETNELPRVMAWVKPFAAFKRGQPVAYAWEPVLVRACRTPLVSAEMVYRDWIAEPMTLRRGLTGAKPAAVSAWLFGVMGLEPDDELDDLYPGTGAVAQAWQSWRRQPSLLKPPPGEPPPSLFDAPASQISAEGFSDYERDAVTVLVKLAGTASPVPASDPRRSPLEVTTPAPT